MTGLSKSLPLEIWVIIVEMHRSKAHVSTLRALSRCCRALACLCQRVLFRDLHIPRIFYGWTSRRDGALARLEDAFTQPPHLATYVHKVRYRIEEKEEENTMVPWILNQLTDNLADVHMEYVSQTPRTPHLDWVTLDVRLRSSIIRVVQSPRLRYLTLKWIKNIPLSVFGSLSSDLMTVKFQGVEVQIQPDYEGLESTKNSGGTPRRVDLAQTKRRLPHIKNLHYFYHDTGGVLASRPFVFDFEHLQFLRISWGNEHQCALGKELMKAASKLERLACVVESPHKSTSGLAKAMLDYGLDVSLTALTIGLAHKTALPTIPDPDEYDLFLGLIKELELLAGKNTVKKLLVHFDTTKGTHDRLTDSLGRLDGDITREAFPHLERFDLEFWVDWEPFAGYAAPGLQDVWAERNRAQCRAVAAMPGLRFGCQVVIIDDLSSLLPLVGRSS
ncbi:hypothetical protein NLJ89_g4464 [Agrocybe chaxingu]|uniref:Uncharacterized protein n=1 Tax=Agrocybe chaxingu TaxID=84603 RepID=A0A9W8K0H5_9AGAR|nr:hypothetical protein NLJ89_g4464 [Agrocybe chaxingu]